MGVFDLIGVAAKGAKKAAPFFSKADVVLDELPRNKGLGNEFLAELVKKGAKPTELKERGIEKALKDKPKMTKAEVKKVFEQKAPPKVQEKVLTSDAPDYEEFLEAKAQEIYGVDWFDLNKDEKKKLDKMFSELPLTQYDKYKTPGGENYREILLKLPEKQNIQPPPDTSKWQVITKSTSPYSGARELQIRDEQNNLVGQRFGFQGSDADAIREVLPAFLNWRARTQDQVNYRSSHYRDDPNLLAHIRVQDFKTPDGKKVLLVDEVQSDWHQEGRKKGYATQEAEAELKLSEQRMALRGEEIRQISSRMAALDDSQLDEFNALATERQRLNDLQAKEMDWGNSVYDAQRSGVPDAPFKKNWHELAMKRVLDYAAENGYDTVAITPGAEQAKRYDLSKHIDSIAYDPETRLLDAWDHNRRQVMRREITDDSQLEDYIGKEAASKLLQAEPVRGKYLLEGQDLQVGGEGMKGFYDKILPDYLNNYGKKYGAQMGEMDLITKPESRGVNIMTPDEPEIYPAQTMKFHSFDITPQMREEIQTKGQPMYGKVAMPALEGLAAGSGAATIGSQMFDENNEQTVQNPVHFTENPDAMLLELMQRN